MPAEPIPKDVANYLDRGWPVAPVHVARRNGKKVVKFLTDNGFKDASKDYEEVADWAVRYPKCGWAIPTGPDTFWAVDADGSEGVQELMKLGELPDTWTVGTPSGGRHSYFAWPSNGGTVRNSASALAPGVDVRGEGGCVFVPPTTGYQLVNNTDLAPAPRHLLVPPAAKPKTLTQTPATPIAKGARNTELTRLAGLLRRHNFTHDSIVAALSFENAERCDPPLHPSEVDEIANSVMRYDPLEGESWTGQSLDLGTILERPPERVMLIDQVLEAERLFMLFGKPGDFKTFLALDMAVSVASGKPFLADTTGQGLMTVQGPVVFVQQDQGAADTRERLHSLYNAYGIKPPIPLDVYAFPQPNLDMMRNWEDVLLPAIQEAGAVLVVIDNLFNVAGIREENSSEIGLAIRNLASIREVTGASIVVLHHPAKGTGWSRGHSVILQNVDQSIKLLRDGDFVRFEEEKERGAGVLTHLSARFDFETYADSRTLKSAKFSKASEEQRQEHEFGPIREEVLEWVGFNPGSKKIDTYNAVGGGRSTLAKVVAQLVRNEQMVIKTGKGGAHHLYLPEDAPDD